MNIAYHLHIGIVRQQFRRSASVIASNTVLSWRGLFIDGFMDAVSFGSGIWVNIAHGIDNRVGFVRL